jgi:hypothetical protein
MESYSRVDIVDEYLDIAGLDFKDKQRLSEEE